MSTLTIMTQILTNYEKAGNHVTAVDIWLFVCLIMVFLALMEYAVAYTFSHYYGDDPLFALAYCNCEREKQGKDRPNSGAITDSATYDNNNNKPCGGDSFYGETADGAVLRSSILRNSFRGRGNGGANTAPPITQHSTATPVIDLDCESTLFRMKSLPQDLSPIKHANSASLDAPSSINSNQLMVKSG